MKRNAIFYLMFTCIFVGLTVGLAHFAAASPDIEIQNTNVKNENKSLAAFSKVMDVVTHKRCVNCHPAGDRPRQGEDSHIHYFNVQRGADGNGLAGYTCETCHHKENNDVAGVPGAPHWALAPREMAWEGKTRVEIATQIMDPVRNGGKSAEEIKKHMTEDELVLWAWAPGVDDEGVARELPPLSKEEWIIAVKEWIDNGAEIPAK